MNYLIVVPRFSKSGDFYPFPFGLAYVSSYLKSKNFNVYCLNLCHHEETETTLELLRTTISKYSINVILTGGMSGHWNLVNDVIANTKKINTNIITVVGGPIITSDPILAMENMQIDYGVIGEGEITAGELASALDNNTSINLVDGIIYREDSNLIQTKERSSNHNLDLLPFPDYEGLDYGKWMELMQYSGQNPILENFDNVRYSPIIGSRSCPFSCTFCYHPLGKIYRQRSLDNIFKEIDYLIENFQTNFLGFSDELFSANTERMFEFADRIKKYNVRWDGAFRVNNVTQDMMQKLKASNLTAIGYGVESLSDKILVSMKKMITKAEIENAFKVTKEAGIYAAGIIILGDPEETEETMLESIDWWKNHPQYLMGLKFIMAIPNSPIYQFAIKNKVITDKLAHVKNNFPIINLTKIPEQRFNDIKNRVAKYNKDLTYVKEGRVIKSEKLTEKYQDCDFYSLTIQCPFCGQVKQYKKFTKSIDKYCNLICKECCSPFKINQKKAFSNFNYFKFIFYKPLYRIYTTLTQKGTLNPSNKIVIMAKKTFKKFK